MKKEKAKELSELFKAYSEGKIIEYKSPGAECWDVDNNFGGSILAIQYRIKPEPKLVPFTFEDAEFLIGKPIRSKQKNVVLLIQVVYQKSIMMHGFDTISYYSLLQNWEFLDGSPCGKYVE